ncbi:MAG: 30S ribosomal protein S8 [Deltaproteobacteria bacterium]|nr:30S ribosomal protein S8 [Deltaproteobacteria bacterium]
MSMTDPIADMLTRIRNAQRAGHETVVIPRSQIKLAIAHVLKQEGYIGGYIDDQTGPQGRIKVFLKYTSEFATASTAVIRGIQRVSTPGRRQYVGKGAIPMVRNGLGIAILTTPQGVITDRQARQAGVGGEVICHVW